MTLCLGVDTSNYATSLAVVDAERKEVVCALKRFLPVKPGQTGLRQSDAVFHHTVALPQLVQQLEAATPLNHLAAVCAAATPRPQAGSYMPCFLAGVALAHGVAAGCGVPLHTTSHQQGHLAAARFGAGVPWPAGQPFLFFHASGGTTQLLLARGNEVEKTVGQSLDLYAGQAIDRLGVRLGYDFPAGPALSKVAAQCDAAITTRASIKGTNCHLSGLQNQCEAHLAAGKAPAWVAKYCLVALAEAFIQMAAAARRLHLGLPLLCAGGVMASECIRREMERRVENVWFCPPEYSADNAVGVAFIGAQAAQGG